MKDKTETLINLILVASVFFSILLLGYGLNFYTFILPLIFFFQIYLPYLYFKHKAKEEIVFYFMPFIFSKLARKNKFLDFENNYYKKFPCWLICSLAFSAITFFKIPILFIGRFSFKTWNNPLSSYDENSQIEEIVNFFKLFYGFQIFSAIVLLFINPIFSLVPLMIAVFTILPFPGNIGYDFYFLDFESWLKFLFLVIISSSLIFITSLAFLGVNLLEKPKTNLW